VCQGHWPFDASKSRARGAGAWRFEEKPGEEQEEQLDSLHTIVCAWFWMHLYAMKSVYNMSCSNQYRLHALDALDVSVAA